MPKLGFDMAEGLLVRWVKAEGEAVEIGEILAEIETDKATVEIEAEAGGVVLKHLVTENSSVPIGAPITVIGEEGEEFDIESVEVESEAVVPEATPPSPIAVAESPSNGDGRLPAGVRASPVARRLADERGIELGSLSGSGPQGRIVKRDVEAAVSASAPAIAPFQPSAVPAETVRIPLSKLRETIGRRMTVVALPI